MVNCTLAFDLYRKWRRTVPGTISVGWGLPFSTAVFTMAMLPLASIC